MARDNSKAVRQWNEQAGQLDREKVPPKWLFVVSGALVFPCSFWAYSILSNHQINKDKFMGLFWAFLAVMSAAFFGGLVYWWIIEGRKRRYFTKVDLLMVPITVFVSFALVNLTTGWKPDFMVTQKDIALKNFYDSSFKVTPSTETPNLYFVILTGGDWRDTGIEVTSNQVVLASTDVDEKLPKNNQPFLVRIGDGYEIEAIPTSEKTEHRMFIKTVEKIEPSFAGSEDDIPAVPYVVKGKQKIFLKLSDESSQDFVSIPIQVLTIDEAKSLMK